MIHLHVWLEPYLIFVFLPFKKEFSVDDFMFYDFPTLSDTKQWWKYR